MSRIKSLTSCFMLILYLAGLVSYYRFMPVLETFFIFLLGWTFIMLVVWLVYVDILDDYEDL